MRRLSCVVLAAVLLCGCSAAPETRQYSATFLDVFDTVTTIVGVSDSETAFRAQAQEIHDALLTYHRLFDVYHEYEGLNNLKTVNDHAGAAAVVVDRKLIALLQDCRSYCALTDGKVNAAMGSVLQLWHEERETAWDDPRSACLPEYTALLQAAQHTDLDNMIIDEAASSIYLADPQLRLDVGAIAKGWATQRVAQAAPEGLLISVGGNICATGGKDTLGTPWVVGIRDPGGGASDYLHTIAVTGGCVVTSGDYQRVYTVDGRPYHHIIDPLTLYPAAYWRAVTVVGSDAGLADALSTALMLLPLEDGLALAEQWDVEALWVRADGQLFYSDGFAKFLRTQVNT